MTLYTLVSGTADDRLNYASSYKGALAKNLSENEKTEIERLFHSVFTLQVKYPSCEMFLEAYLACYR